MNFRPTHRVSVKVALIDPVTSRVLVTVLEDDKFGLPGGHVERDETPEQALARELREELGLDEVGNLTRRDFWKDPLSDRLILGFTGRLSESADVHVDGVEVLSTVWASRRDVEEGRVHSKSYEPFLLDILP